MNNRRKERGRGLLFRHILQELDGEERHPNKFDDSMFIVQTPIKCSQISISNKSLQTHLTSDNT